MSGHYFVNRRHALSRSQLGPNKHLCSSLLGAPGCTSQADCAANFTGEHVNCLQTNVFSTCIKECKP